MSLPTSYTETTLAQYMHATLGATADALGLSAPTSTPGAYQEAVNEALLDAGVTELTTLTGAMSLRRLRALARLEAWRLAAAQTSGEYDFSADGASHSRSQLHAMALQQLAQAELEAAALGALREGGLVVGVDDLNYVQDPYQFKGSLMDTSLSPFGPEAE